MKDKEKLQNENNLNHKQKIKKKIEVGYRFFWRSYLNELYFCCLAQEEIQFSKL